MNFECISPRPWMEGYAEATGNTLPFEELRQPLLAVARATMADLYPGSGQERQGAILIDAHLAANAVGATPAARPEDTDIDPRSGDLLIAFTSGGSDGDGRADPEIFRGPRGEASCPYGWVMRVQDGL